MSEMQTGPMTNKEISSLKRLANIGPLGFVSGGMASQAFDGITRLLAEIDRLKAELAEARKDTQRLDWLEYATPERLDYLRHRFEFDDVRDVLDSVANKEATWLA